MPSRPEGSSCREAQPPDVAICPTRVDDVRSPSCACLALRGATLFLVTAWDFQSADIAVAIVFVLGVAVGVWGRGSGTASADTDASDTPARHGIANGRGSDTPDLLPLDVNQ